jgi:hypothetical protein
MASRRECAAAVQRLVTALHGIDEEVRRQRLPDRSVCCTLSDLGTTYVGELRGGAVCGRVRQGQADGAQVRVTLASDDLLALESGELRLATALAQGRVKVEAGLADLLLLRHAF